MPEAYTERELLEAKIRKNETLTETFRDSESDDMSGARKKLMEDQEVGVERVTGVEPATLCLASIRSSQLSYTRV